MERPRALYNIGADREIFSIQSLAPLQPFELRSITPSGTSNIIHLCESFFDVERLALPTYFDRALRSPGHTRREPDPTSAMGHQIHELPQQLIALILHLDSPAEKAALLDTLGNAVGGAQMSLCLDAVDRSRAAHGHRAGRNMPPPGLFSPHQRMRPGSCHSLQQERPFGQRSHSRRQPHLAVPAPSPLQDPRELLVSSRPRRHYLREDWR